MESVRVRHNRHRSSSGARLTVAAVGVSLVLALTACTGDPVGETSSPPPVATATASPTEIALVPEGTGEDNKPFFDQVNAATAADENAGGRDFIDALVAAGFDKATMEVTKDATTLGDRAESIQFSVRWGDSCLIGQFGPSVGGYHSTIQPVLATDRCLIGETRPIDW